MEETVGTRIECDKTVIKGIETTLSWVTSGHVIDDVLVGTDSFFGNVGQFCAGIKNFLSGRRRKMISRLKQTEKTSRPHPTLFNKSFWQKIW
ncbi:hypothetical protein [Bartonella harrusi]|uniref:Uncharacterized protein n=1 Tax=Bartonella harrusi TaxID=2961895 RepID=A0ABY5EWD4_9HYPH|nr:hypothetical protein [Bartonella harrusi]UTO28843.1 hypothetical protein NMK50_02230 [Bartonella harrusi]